MERDIQRYVRIMNNVRPQLEMLSRSHEIITTSEFEMVARQIQRYQDDIGRFLSTANYTAGYADLLRSAVELNKLSLNFSDDLKSALDHVHHSWLSDWRDTIDPFRQIESMAKFRLLDSAYYAAMAKPIWDDIDFGFIGKQLNIQQSFIAELQRSMSSFVESYCLLTESFLRVDDLVEIPSFILPGATLELSTTGHALNVLRPADVESTGQTVDLEPHLVLEEDVEDPYLVTLLQRVDPRLVEVYRGAVAALNGDNSDRSRHVLTSLRELWNHLLRILAPIEDVREWIEEHGMEGFLQKNGKPTRHAKIRYALRGLDAEPLMGFVEADTKAMVKLYALYNRLHELDTGVTNEQLRMITFRTKSYLSYILEIREWSIE